ncbi:MAG: hypothetical protein R3C59_17680 [Planctomycetaceae bacterium]
MKTNPARALTQYGDFKGGFLDGFDGLTVFNLFKECGLAKGYWPVGIRIYGFGVSESSESPSVPTLKAKVLCVDPNKRDLALTKFQNTAVRIPSYIPLNLT